MLRRLCNPMEHYTFHVVGMECRGCGYLLEREIRAVDDVLRSAADHEADIVEFTVPDPETGSYVEHLVSDLGYEVTAIDVE